ncbi:hypothetical protein KKF84_15305, partial [Myxococcota bacterium]|nr:hypothetical protein [Myxococcota bacterium]MBU1536690.1 hypothetical protein [Myxococcota bacterium]
MTVQHFSILIIFLLLLTPLACDEKISGNNTCGDSVLDLGEECDTTNFGQESCFSRGYYGGTLACDSCEIREDGCTPFGRCGDSVIQTENESCDGANIPLTTCESLGYEGEGTVSCGENCRFDISQCQGAEQCGDGVVTAPEECDLFDFQGESCESLGFLGGVLSCGSDCRRDESRCYTEVVCGDGLVQGEEQCEVSDLDGASCTALGFDGGQLLCGEDCRFDVSRCEGEGGCQDGTAQTPWESCDGDDLGGESCTSLGYHDGYLLCSDGCTFNTNDCELYGYCGDGLLDPDYETCDGSDLGSITCSSLGYSGGTVSCNPDCGSVDDSQCFNIASCGNETLDEGEECEGEDLAGATCRSLGYFAGNLSCSAQGCVFDTSDCRKIVQLSSGERHTCGLDDKGEVWCWGFGERGILGDGNSLSSATPVKVDPAALNAGETFTFIAAGWRHTCGLTTLGKIFCWGPQDSCEVTGINNGDAPAPSALQGYNPSITFGTVASGRFHSCASDNNGQLYCWGDNSMGQLGSGDLDPCQSPRTTDTSDPVNELFSKHDTTCAKLSSAHIACWGDNPGGSLGTGSASPLVTAPEPLLEANITGGDYFAHLSTGMEYGCAIAYNGGIYCWGSNLNGRFCSTTPT